MENGEWREWRWRFADGRETRGFSGDDGASTVQGSCASLLRHNLRCTIMFMLHKTNRWKIRYLLEFDIKSQYGDSHIRNQCCNYLHIYLYAYIQIIRIHTEYTQYTQNHKGRMVKCSLSGPFSHVRQLDRPGSGYRIISRATP